jgi:hypothetical protein
MINGIMKRHQLELYRGLATYYEELQNCLGEFAKLMGFKSDILLEVFQSLTKLNLSKDEARIVVNCGNCGVYILASVPCKACQNEFYCDRTCLKNHRLKHAPACQAGLRTCPRIIYPLQVELHCGSDLADNLAIHYQHERRLTLRERGKMFIKGFHGIISKNRWLKNNDYTISCEKDRICIEVGERTAVDRDREI